MPEKALWRDNVRCDNLCNGTQTCFESSWRWCLELCHSCAQPKHLIHQLIFFNDVCRNDVRPYDLFKVHLFVSTYFIFQTTILEQVTSNWSHIFDIMTFRGNGQTHCFAATMAIQRRVCLLVLGFSLTAGFIDLVTLVHFSQFAGLQTGNMILIGRDLYRLTLPDESKTELLKAIAFHVATLISHFAGVLCFCALAHTCKGPVRVGAWLKGRPVRVGAVLVGVLTLSGALLDLLSKGNEWSVCFIAASMGARTLFPRPTRNLAASFFWWLYWPPEICRNLPRCCSSCWFASVLQMLRSNRRAVLWRPFSVPSWVPFWVHWRSLEILSLRSHTATRSTCCWCLLCKQFCSVCTTTCFARQPLISIKLRRASLQCLHRKHDSNSERPQRDEVFWYGPLDGTIDNVITYDNDKYYIYK